jgi:hypothetical protein
MLDQTNIDTLAPILPGEGLGGLRLRTSLKDMYDLVKEIAYSNRGTFSLESPFLARYEINDIIVAVFLTTNGKLVKIGALRDYKGLLFEKIIVGMPIADIMHLEPRVYYDSLEEQLFIKGVPGVTLETENPSVSPEEDPNQRIVAITVYIPELSDAAETYERGDW